MTFPDTNRADEAASLEQASEGTADRKDAHRLQSFSGRDCPACGAHEREVLFSVRAEQFCRINSTYRSDFSEILGIDRHESYPIARCASCRFVYAGLLPADDFLTKVYDEVIDPERGMRESLAPGRVAEQLRIGALILLDLASAQASDAPWRLLDFGCGYGTLARCLAGPRLKCFGFDTSPSRVAYIESCHIPVLRTLDEVLAAGPYHAVILCDVLEHVPHPRELLTFCRKILVPRGLLSVNVPCFEHRRVARLRTSVTADHLHDREVNPWEHLNYYSPPTLRAMLQQAGFHIRRPPGNLDVGMRPNLRGLKRWGNAVRSGFRLLRLVSGVSNDGTHVHAQPQDG